MKDKNKPGSELTEALADVAAIVGRPPAQPIKKPTLVEEPLPPATAAEVTTLAQSFPNPMAKKPSTAAAIDNLASKANVCSPLTEEQLLKSEVPKPMAIMEATPQPVPPKVEPTQPRKCLICATECQLDGIAICRDEGGTHHLDYAPMTYLCSPCYKKLVTPPEASIIALPTLMLELSVIGEILSKRHKFATVSLSCSSNAFHFVCSWTAADKQQHRYISRKISDSLTPKGLALVIGEVKSGVGI